MEDTPTPPPSPPSGPRENFRAIPIETIHLTKNSHEPTHYARPRDSNNFESRGSVRGSRDTPLDKSRKFNRENGSVFSRKERQIRNFLARGIDQGHRLEGRHHLEDRGISLRQGILRNRQLMVEWYSQRVKLIIDDKPCLKS